MFYGNKGSKLREVGDCQLIVAILDFVGSAALQAASECPLRR